MPRRTFVLGRHYCWDDDWKNGLPHLAKGSDASCGSRPNENLHRRPEAENDQIGLADAWWNLGKARNGEDGDCPAAPGRLLV